MEFDDGSADFLAGLAMTDVERDPVLVCQGGSPFKTAVTCPEQKK